MANQQPKVSNALDISVDAAKDLTKLLTLEYRTKHLGGGLSYWNV